METQSDIQTVADTIEWLGKTRYEKESYQNLASAIYSVSVEVDLLVVEAMDRANKDEQNENKQNKQGGKKWRNLN